MANQEHLDLLKQGVEVWNQWRLGHPDILPDFSVADLSNTDLSSADFHYADLHNTNFANAILSHANLFRTDLSGADLSGADVHNAELRNARFNYTRVNGANFSGAVIAWTSFGHINLQLAQGLEQMRHMGPSYIDPHTFVRSQGHIPKIFLQRAGVPESFIENRYALIGSISPIEYYTCFISYSSKDQSFAEYLYVDLQRKGVRCWFAPEEMKIGDKIRARIDEAIYLQDKLLLVLSEHALASPWVEEEVEAALEKERRQQREVLFPVRLDESVIHTPQAWAATLRRTRHIGDFTRWTNPQGVSTGVRALAA